MINSAKKYIYITTPYLICDYEILNALCISAKKGVDVRIITPHIPDKKTVFLMTRSNYENLIKTVSDCISGYTCLEKFMPESKIYSSKIYDSIIITYFKWCVNRKIR